MQALLGMCSSGYYTRGFAFLDVHLVSGQGGNGVGSSSQWRPASILAALQEVKKVEFSDQGSQRAAFLLEPCGGMVFNGSPE